MPEAVTSFSATAAAGTGATVVVGPGAAVVVMTGDAAFVVGVGAAFLVWEGPAAVFAMAGATAFGKAKKGANAFGSDTAGLENCGALAHGNGPVNNGNVGSPFGFGHGNGDAVVGPQPIPKGSVPTRCGAVATVGRRGSSGTTNPSSSRLGGWFVPPSADGKARGDFIAAASSDESGIAMDFRCLQR